MKKFSIPRELTYDVVVVGGGPAGNITAKYIAKKNISVLIIEKRQEIGVPVRCGEGISKYWLSEVDIKPNEKWIANEVDGARIFSPNGMAFVVNERIAGREVGYVIERDIFDKELAKSAISAGADLLLKTSAINVLKENNYVVGVKATCMGTPIRINAKITVGADGFESQVGRWAGINTNMKPSDLISCLEYRMTNINVDRRFCDFYIGSCAPGGYAWVFPKSEDTANVGIGIQLSKLKSSGEVKKYLDNFIKVHKELAKGTPIEIIAGGVSVGQPLEKIVANGILLVGDSARQTDPLTGGGIANACVCGKFAAEVIVDSIESKDYSENFLATYEKKCADRFEDTMYRNWLVKEKLVSLSDDTLNKIVAALIEVGVEKLSVGDLLKAIKEKHPELVKEFEDFL